MKELKRLKKDICLIEFVKRETIEALKDPAKDSFYNIIKLPFKKNESLDKEVIGYVKKIESNLKKELGRLLSERNKFNKEVINKIKDYPVFDEIIHFFNKNIIKFNKRTTLQNILKFNRSVSLRNIENSVIN